MHTSKSRHILLQAVAAVALCASAAHAADYVWNSPNAGNWSDLSENGWNAASYPAAAGDTAMFSQDITGNRTITINVADARVGELTLTDTDPSHNWTIARTGSNRLTLDNGASEAVITSTTGSNTISAPITLASHLRLVVTGTSLTFNGGSDAISGAYNITIDGTSTGNVSLSNNTSIANNINNIIINGGTLTINAGSSNGQNNITVNSGGRLRVTGGYGGLNDSSYVTLSGTGILDYSGYSGTDWMTGVQSTSTTSQWIMGTSGTIISNSRTFNGVISGGGPGANLQLNSYTLGGVNTYQGKVSTTSGTLKLNVANSIANAYEVSIGGGSILDIGGNSQSFVSISGGGIIRNSASGTHTITITGGSDKNFSGSITNGTGGGQIVALTINATGTQILSGVNTYTGPTNILAGTLQVDGSLASNVTVTGGVLAGDGTVPNVNVLAGGTIAPGASVGLLTAGQVTLAGTLRIEVNGPNAAAEVDGHDQLVVSGLELLDGSNLDLQLAYLPSGSDSFLLVNNIGSDPIIGAFSTVNGMPVSGNQFTIGGNTFTLDYAGGDGNDLVVMVPEPGMAAAMLFAGSILAVRRRRVE